MRIKSNSGKRVRLTSTITPSTDSQRIVLEDKFLGIDASKRMLAERRGNADIPRCIDL